MNSVNILKTRRNSMGNIFDLNDGDFIFSTSSNLGIDTNGDLNMRMSDHMSMDLNTGELHLNTGWKTIGYDEDEND